jgi:hypothetical protein
MVDIALGGFSGIQLDNFKIAPEVVGASLTFQSAGRTVQIKLPTDVNQEANYTCQHWKADDKPYSYNLHRLFVRADFGEQLDLPPEILGKPTNQFDLIPTLQQDQLETLAYSFALTADTLYNRFLGVVRWKMLDGVFGRPEHQDFPGWTKVIDWASDASVWGKGGMLKVCYRLPVTADDWSQIEAALQNDGTSPIYFDLLFDAEQHYEARSLNRCVVETAMACEVYVKERITTHLPKPLSPVARSLIERARMPDQFKMLRETLTPAEEQQFDGIRPNLNQLIEARNKVVHTGKNDGLTDPICLDFLHTARSLLTLGRLNAPKFFPRNTREFQGIKYSKIPGL